MKNIRVLDCTLRDGGYVNDFSFGKETIKDTVDLLSKAKIDCIECGFLKSNQFDEDKSLYRNVEKLSEYIGEKHNNTMYVLMIKIGEIHIDEICDKHCSLIDGLRLSFHESEITQAISFAKKLKEKGYYVFLQPIGTVNYSTNNLSYLIDEANKLYPYAFYLVDTLGQIHKNEILNIFEHLDKNLDSNITIGFHSHNNLNMSFDNVQRLIKNSKNRSLIIDSSLLGMGRGAGNLNTETITHYLNENYNSEYDLNIIFRIIKKHIEPLTKEYSWGNNLGYFYSAVHGCHPNYVLFLLKKTNNMKLILDVLENIEESKKIVFDKAYIEKIFLEQKNGD